ncbi:hypothetical protein CALCODRAFT_505913 [Calocera cornea HHB12733]|uniref:Uncharacterized protein n=1 Tax=Calocera cornea HHB12733 TaxID=1353952 RepID=A0A165JGF4_9BASI|nr:hypothetical protein CALCODRAFT_505913 [Calocera cornea HHB12733]
MDVLIKGIPPVTLDPASFDQWLTIQEQLSGQWDKTQPDFEKHYTMMQSYWLTTISQSNGWEWDASRRDDEPFVNNLGQRLRGEVTKQMAIYAGHPDDFSLSNEMICYFAAFAIVHLIQNYVNGIPGGHAAISAHLARRFKPSVQPAKKRLPFTVPVDDLDWEIDTREGDPDAITLREICRYGDVYYITEQGEQAHFSVIGRNSTWDRARLCMESRIVIQDSKEGRKEISKEQLFMQYANRVAPPSNNMPNMHRSPPSTPGSLASKAHPILNNAVNMRGLHHGFSAF